MLYMPKTRFAQSFTRALTAGTVLMDEGLALVAGPGGTVKLASGVANEHFVGFSVNQRGPLFALPTFDEVTVSAAAPTVKLTKTPLGARVTVRNPITQALLESGTDYNFDQATNEVTDLDAGDYVIAYEFSPTMIEARVIQGDVQPGGTVPMNYDFTGVLAKGDIYTSSFEVADDWTVAGVKIRLGANGKLTTQGTGTVINAYVIGTPNAQSPFLGICVQ